MSTRKSGFLVAAAQVSPVFLNRSATVDKACRLISEAGATGARLILFPECFIPAYPLWIWFIPAGRTFALRELYSRLLDNSIRVPDDSTARLCAAAKESGIAVAIGINEVNAEASGGTLYNSLLLIGSDGEIVGTHRKLVPTAGERLVHGQGDGSSVQVHEIDRTRVGSLICWENYMPLARYALYADGVEILLAPTWDRGEPWLSTLRHIGKEGRVYVIGCCGAVRRDEIPDDLEFKNEYLPNSLDWVNPGGSAVADPDGKWVVEPVFERQEILYAQIDPQAIQGSRFQLDVAGHYGRSDVFQLLVRRQGRPIVRVEELDSDQEEILE